MIQFIKELFTSRFIDGKIKGCRKYSFAYFHEYRHLIQMKNKLLHGIWNWLPYITGCLGLAMIFLYLLTLEKIVLFLGSIFILPISLFLFIIEFDANLYALIKIIFNGK